MISTIIMRGWKKIEVSREKFAQSPARDLINITVGPLRYTYLGLAMTYKDQFNSIKHIPEDLVVDFVDSSDNLTVYARDQETLAEFLMYL